VVFYKKNTKKPQKARALRERFKHMKRNLNWVKNKNA
jgi:hypothetical protein